ncbi:MAG: hypothetical protein ACRDTN_17440 [Mycobacterium sp.]
MPVAVPVFPNFTVRFRLVAHGGWGDAGAGRRSPSAPQLTHRRFCILGTDSAVGAPSGEELRPGLRLDARHDFAGQASIR